MGQQNQSNLARPDFVPVSLEFFKDRLSKEPAVYDAAHEPLTHPDLDACHAVKVAIHKTTGRLLSCRDIQEAPHYWIRVPRLKLQDSWLTSDQFYQRIFCCVFREYLGYARFQQSIPAQLELHDQILICRAILSMLQDVQLSGEQAKAVHSLSVARFKAFGESQLVDQIYRNCSVALDQWHAEREILGVLLEYMIIQ